MESGVSEPTLPAQTTELDLITQAQEGSREAFNKLVLRHRKGVVNVVYRLCGNAQQAEDVAQETFIRAWKKLPAYRPRAPFRNWLYRIATNLALDALRREKVMVDVEALPLEDATSTPPEAALEAKERVEMLRTAVLALPLASRSVLVLREYEGMSYREIAKTLEIPVGTVMSRLHYARGALQRSLAGLLEQP